MVCEANYEIDRRTGLFIVISVNELSIIPYLDTQNNEKTH